MTKSEITKLFARTRHLKALVIGDLMHDEYLWGNTKRISPEAPVPVVDISHEGVRLGGAGNVINNLLSLGCQVKVASVIGDDPCGHMIVDQLRKCKIDIDGVIMSVDRKTTRKIRILAGNQQVLRIDHENRQDIDKKLEDLVIKYAKSQLPRVQVLLLSDYLKGVLTNRLTKSLITMGRDAGIPVLVDPKGADYSKYHRATLVTPNLKEAAEATGFPISSNRDVCRAGFHLLKDLALDALVLTRSEEGMTLFMTGKNEIHMPILAREVFDVTGAGDTVLASLGIGLAAGLELTDAVQLANLAAGIVVGKVGTATVDPDEILRAISLSTKNTRSKICDCEELLQIVLKEKKRGRIIVFTNGCFDLLHVGHVKYLQKARELGDILIIGLNSDVSVTRLKGKNRPLIGEEERTQILAALDCVDYVCLFDEETPLDLIRVLCPDILVKGGDYKLEEIVGREVVENLGGRVELINFVDAKSTTNIINKILTRYSDE